jgi:uncharacterized protein YceK
MRKLILGLMVLVFAGCSTVVQERLDSFTGQDIEIAQQALGYNYATRPLKEGRTAYTWGRSRTVGVVNGSTGFLTGAVASHHCEINLIADKSGKVIQNRFKDTGLGAGTCWRLID